MHANSDRDTQTTTNSLLMGFFCGAALGAAIGLMFAPRPGTELRQQLADSAGKLKESAGKFRQKAGEVTDKVSEGLNEMVRSGRRAYGRASEPATPETQPATVAHFDV